MRVTDAQCLAAYEAITDNVQIVRNGAGYAVIDVSKIAAERTLWIGDDFEEARTHHYIEYMRPLLTAALNVC